MVQAGILGDVAAYDELKYGWSIKAGCDFSEYETWLMNPNVPTEKVDEECKEKIEDINFALESNDVRYSIPEYGKNSKRNCEAVFRKIVEEMGRISRDRAIYFIIGNATGMLAFGSFDQALEKLRQVNVYFPKLNGFKGNSLLTVIEQGLDSKESDSIEAALTTVKLALQRLNLKMVILFVTADPYDQTRLRTQKEQRFLKEALEKSKLGAMYRIEPLPSCRPEDIDRAIVDFKPTILHFSGHAGAKGLCFIDDNDKSAMISPDRLAKLLGRASRDGLSVVILNACTTAGQCKSIAERVPAVVAMEGAVGDEKALDFTKFFYQALGAGETIQECFDSAVNNSDLVQHPGRMNPQLILKGRISASREGGEEDHDDGDDDDDDDEDEDDNSTGREDQGKLAPVPVPASMFPIRQGPSQDDISFMNMLQAMALSDMQPAPAQALRQPPTFGGMMTRISARGTVQRRTSAVSCDHCGEPFDHDGGFHCDMCNYGDFDICTVCFVMGNRCGSPNHRMITWDVMGM